MKKYLLSVLCLLWGSTAFAQATDDGSEEYHIPVVFHLIHDFGDEYFHDSFFTRTVKHLNEVFHKENADTGKIIDAYRGFINNSNQPYIGNARITFHLATKDPEGNPTTGITRRRSYLTNDGGDYIKYEQWPAERYLNVWLVNRVDADVLSLGWGAFGTSPAEADLAPHYDGLVTQLYGSVFYILMLPELGRMLGLKYVYGDHPLLTGTCGDDGIDDTPPTKGHDASGACGDLLDLYDTACLYTRNVALNKPRIDSVKRLDGSYAVISDTATVKGISFECRTASTLNSLSFYPAAPLGSVYKIGLSRDGVLIDSMTVISTIENAKQDVAAHFLIPAAPKTTLYELRFIQNPGALRDTVSGTVYSRGVEGSVLSKEESTDGNYNFFYDWKITHGYYKIYAGDSLVDYPDTTNSQNIMDQMNCSYMFTYGQVMKMRETLRHAVGKRNQWVSPENLSATGALDPVPAMKPKAEILVFQGVYPIGVRTKEPNYFSCLGGAGRYSSVFKNMSWRADPTSVSWSLSNDATTGTSTAMDKVTSQFGRTGWANITMIASNAQGSDTATVQVYVADTSNLNPVGYWQEFNSTAEYASWPIFNYYNNRYKWEYCARGYFDNTGICYKNYDDRVFPENLLGSPEGDYDDFFSPAFDLSALGDNGNINFMYAGAYTTTDTALKKDKLEIAYSSDCGGDWTILKTMSGEELETTSPVSDREYLSHYEDWKPMSIDLKIGATKIRDTRVFFRFRYKPSAFKKLEGRYAAGNTFYMDRIHISNNPLDVNEMILGERMATLAPNPTNANAFVLFGKANANVQISVTDVTGKQVYSLTTKVDQNNARVEIPASALGMKGFYLVRITGDGDLNQTGKLLVY